MSLMIPKLEFIYLYPKSHYLWIKDNPKFAEVAAMSLEEITDVVFAAALTVESKIQPHADRIFELLSEYSGFVWQEHKVKVYPTFLGPSYSDPLSLKVVEMRHGNMVPLHVDRTLGTLIHELSHIIMPTNLFADNSVSEQVMDLTTYRVMDELSFDKSQYLAWKDQKWSQAGPDYEVGTIAEKDLFNPTVRHYLEKS